jgi:hypothetical protein
LVYWDWQPGFLILRDAMGEDVRHHHHNSYRSDGLDRGCICPLPVVVDEMEAWDVESIDKGAFPQRKSRIPDQMETLLGERTDLAAGGKYTACKRQVATLEDSHAPTSNQKALPSSPKVVTTPDEPQSPQINGLTPSPILLHTTNSVVLVEPSHDEWYHFGFFFLFLYLFYSF